MLWTLILPFINSTNFLATDNPTISLSTLSDDLTSNILVWSSFLIPTPVSDTIIIKLHISFNIIYLTVSLTSPTDVYLNALLSKLLTISLTCTLSPINSYGRPCWNSTLKLICLPLILVELSLHNLTISSLNRYGVSTIGILVDSILFISSILSTTSRSDVEASIKSLASSLTPAGRVSP